MTYKTKLLMPVFMACLAPSLAFAQERPSTATAGPYPVTGNVPALCAFGTIAGATGRFDLNVLIDTTTGFLRTDLAPPSRTITGSWCNARSSLNVAGTRMNAQGFTTTPPTGFSTGVDYTASASSWTPSPAVYATGVATAQASATQSQTAPNASDIVLTLSTFATQGGPTLRPVADPNYAGTVTLTLTPTS